MAAKSGLSAEELLRLRIDQWLARPDEEFVRATEHVFRKNAELYRRLA